MKKEAKPFIKLFSPLQPTSKPKDRSKIYGFDIETDPLDQNRFICACISNGEIAHTFFSPTAILDFVRNERSMRSAVLIATNLAYDYFGTFMQTSEDIDIFERKNILYAIKLRQGNGYHVAQFLDTYRFYPVSVEKLGQLLKIPKLDDPRKDDEGQYMYGTPTSQEEMDALVKYCSNDAYISYVFYTNIVLEWCESRLIRCGLSNTSNALRLYQTYYLKETWVPHTHQINEIIKLAYYGGRVETFTRGPVLEVDHYDINSLYPFCMTKVFPFPNSLKKAYKAGPNFIKDYEGVSYVKLYIPQQRIGPLPYRHNGRLIFPTGYIEGWYTHIELRATLKYGVQILEYGDCYYYTKTFDPFTEFVNTMYSERMQKKKEGNPLEIMDKLAMNGLYGRFGMQYNQIDSIKSSKQMSTEDHLMYDRVEELRHGYYRVTTDDNAQVPCFAFPIIAAYVTAYGRIELLKKMKQYQEHILYCDTDSIFIRHNHGTFSTSEKLGDLKLESGKTPYEKVVFVKSKVYAIQTDDKQIVKWKGLGHVKDTRTFLALLTTKHVTQTRLLKIRTYLKAKDHHKLAKVPINAPYIQHTSLDLEDVKRVWPDTFSPKKMQQSMPIHFHTPKSI